MELRIHENLNNVKTETCLEASLFPISIVTQKNRNRRE
jgi:hypothetical protein